MRNWNLPGSDTEAAAARIIDTQPMPRPVAMTLVRRGLEDRSVRETFLNPKLKALGDPRIIQDMLPGVERAWKAIDRKEKFFVHGDYDVDGLTGTTFLTRTLRALGGDVEPFVPNRDEGYGLGEAGIEAARESGATVFISVDCGMTAVKEIDQLNQLGLDVIVLDHHQPGSEDPKALALVNPLIGEAKDHFANLSAVGVAAKFLHAMALVRPGMLPPEVYKEALQLVAMGTIADVVPLLGENRILVSYGLRRLGRSKWVGVQALKATARIRKPRLSANDVAFGLAPRINAMGRMGEAREALRLLLSDDPVEAYKLADTIERLNKDRRKADATVLDDAMIQLEQRGEMPPAIVLWADTWPVGVVGIAASRLLDRFHRPVCLISMNGETGRGSARSKSGFSWPRAFDACRELLVEGGGHHQAAGLEIERRHLETFRKRIEELAANSEATPESEPWEIDATVELDELDADCVAWLDRLEPFGNGNPEPLFGSSGFRLSEKPTVVGGKHLSLSFAGKNGKTRAIAFGMGERVDEFDKDQEVEAVLNASFDTWRGGRHVQFIIRDLKAKGS